MALPERLEEWGGGRREEGKAGRMGAQGHLRPLRNTAHQPSSNKSARHAAADILARAYPCPACGAFLTIRRMYNKKLHVQCSGCRRSDILEPCGNLDEAVLEFACRCDDGRIADPAEGGGRSDGTGGGGMDVARLAEERLVRSSTEIDEMIAGRGVDALTEHLLRTDAAYVSHYRRIERPAPDPGPPPASVGLCPGIAGRLAASGIRTLYGFQAEAIRRILAGENVVIEAPTASGKTEAFAASVIEALRRRDGAPPPPPPLRPRDAAAAAAAGGPDSPSAMGALFVYPTKALARDQFPKISALAESAGLRAAVFDGDTGDADRRRVLRSPPHVLATNFDVLHYHMMRRTALSALLASARHLVVDEVHTYTGVFGAAVHHIVRRLDRLAGRRLRIVAASATLGNAAEFCGTLFGRPFSHVVGAGAAASTEFIMLFPTMKPRSTVVADLAHTLASSHRKKTMVFSGSHAGAEVAAIKARRRGVKIDVHRAGLPDAHRRRVEESFRRGAARAVSCTPTLELGIDIGDVDAVVSSPAPYNRLVQRIGRAARRGRRGYAVLALGNDPISQYYSNHPSDYFEDAEGLHVDPSNPVVASYQALAMACDRAVLPEEASAQDRAALDEHVRLGNAVVRGGRYAAVPEKAHAALSKYSIRGIAESLDIVLDGRRVGERAFPMALDELHPGAVYLMAGARYRVGSNDYPAGGRHAVLERPPPGRLYYTKAIATVWPLVEEVLETRTAFGAEAAMCRLLLRRVVSGYVTVDLDDAPDEQAVSSSAGEPTLLSEPIVYSYETKGLVLRAPIPRGRLEEAAAGGEEAAHLAGASFHAAEHVLIEAGSMVTGAAPRDLGGISMGGTGVIFVHDGAVGGTGASRALYDSIEKAVARAAAVVRECPCRSADGCPRCTYSYMCGNNNAPLDKAGALESLELLASGEQTWLGEAVTREGYAGTVVPVV